MRNQRPDIILGPQQQQQQQHEQSRVQLSVGWNNFVLVSDRTWSLGRAVDQEKEGKGGEQWEWEGRGALARQLDFDFAFAFDFSFLFKIFLVSFFSLIFFWVCARPCPSWAN